ncbi:MAG: tetratricopeptide repeat protein [Methanomicrobiales archaeon]|nr:tetratricopeptide repeat protein [Methanomicrobiales archaeon]
MKEETLTERGIQLAKKGKMDEARKVFQLVIDETPDDAAAWCNYATTYFHEEKHAKALPYFKKAIDLDPAFHGPYLSAGSCLTTMGLDMDAIRLYDQALKIIPDDYEIWYNPNYAIN